MRRLVPLVCVCLFLVTAAEPAFAQQRLFVHTASEIVELDSRLPSLGTVIHRFLLPGLGVRTSQVVSFGGGTSLVWAAEGAILLFDTSSGLVRRFTFPGFTAADVLGTDGNARLLVRGQRGPGADVVLVANARSGEMRFLTLGRPSVDYGAVAYAHASDVLFVSRPTDSSRNPYHDVDVLQAGTGVLLTTLDISPVSAGELSTNAAGTRLYVNEFAGTFAFDVVSGTQLASNPSGAFGFFDELRNRLISHFPAGPRRGLAAYSGDSLQLLGTVQIPPLASPTDGYGPFRLEKLDVSGLSATIFVLQATGIYFGHYADCDTGSRLVALHADTGQVRRIVNTTATLGQRACGADLIRITEPAPPPAPTVNVSGSQVTLNWRAPFGATQYEVEAGSAPGLANVTTIRVSDPQLVVDNAPSGTYYVRVRAINTIGRSQASQEVRMIVP